MKLRENRSWYEHVHIGNDSPKEIRPSMEIRLRTGSWNELRDDAQVVRTEVFIVEQNIPPELEWDDMDAQSLHAVAYDATGLAVGTARLLPDNHIGRMAVLESRRSRGVGSRLLQAMMDAARQRGAQEVMLNAQLAAMPFYMRHGFVEEGGVFDDAGIPHKFMRHRFSAA